MTIDEPKEVKKVAAKLRKIAQGAEIIRAYIREREEPRLAKMKEERPSDYAYNMSFYGGSVEKMIDAIIARRIDCTKLRGVQTIRISAGFKFAELIANELTSRFPFHFVGRVINSDGVEQLAYQYNR